MAFKYKSGKAPKKPADGKKKGKDKSKGFVPFGKKGSK